MGGKGFVTYEQQQAMGLVGERPKGHRSRADLGLPVVESVARPAKISQATSPPAVRSMDWVASDTPYDATKGEYMDEGKAFMLQSLPLSLVSSLGMGVTSLYAGVPFFSLLILAIIFMTFCLTFFVCWLINRLISHYGVQMVRALLGYRLLRHEQKERHAYYRGLANG